MGNPFPAKKLRFLSLVLCRLRRPMSRRSAKATKYIYIVVKHLAFCFWCQLLSARESRSVSRYLESADTHHNISPSHSGQQVLSILCQTRGGDVPVWESQSESPSWCCRTGTAPGILAAE